MSSVPHHDPQPQRRSGKPTNLLVEALLDESRAQVTASESEARVRRALERNPQACNYTWQTASDREAEMRVYFLAAGQLDILASELIRIDFRRPTAQERCQVEAEFNTEMDAAGDAWVHVCETITDEAS